MNNYVPRNLEKSLKSRIRDNPAVAVLGARQTGKSTLAKHFISSLKDAVFLDLEKPSDLNKLRDPEGFLALHKGKPVCFDEIQRKPELFEVLRPIIDERNCNGQFLILGSASPDLLRQSGESLAGRISYLELTPFMLNEVGRENEKNLWLKGGFPRSFLNPELSSSFAWRTDFIRTFLERDISGFGFSFSPETLRRLWRMCAHSHGQTLNLSKLGASLGVSHHTVRSYIEALVKTFLLRILEPYDVNLKKRLVKTPKIYIRDTGLLHALLGVEDFDELYGHPIFGFSWEGFVIEHLIAATPWAEHSFFRTSSGTEIDLVLSKGKKIVAVEAKATSSPSLGKSFRYALDAVQPDETYIVAPVDEPYPIERGVVVTPLAALLENPPLNHGPR